MRAMHITRIKTNVKGYERGESFGPATLIVGPNFSGKTAMLSALRLGLSGFMPQPIGKTGQAIYSALAPAPESPGTLYVSIEPNAGRPFESSWTKSTSGSVRASIGTPAEIRLPGVLVDPRQFFTMTRGERTRAIFEACGTGSVTAQAIRLAVQEDVPVCPKHVMESVLAEVEACFTADLPPTIAIAKGIERAKLLARTAEQEYIAQTAAVTALSVPFDSIPENHDKTIDGIQVELGKANTQLGTLLAMKDSAKKSVKMIDGLRAAVSQMEGELAMMDLAPEAPMSPELVPMPRSLAAAIASLSSNPDIAPLLSGVEWSRVRFEPDWIGNIHDIGILRTIQAKAEGIAASRARLEARARREVVACSVCGSTEWPISRDAAKALSEHRQVPDLDAMTHGHEEWRHEVAKAKNRREVYDAAVARQADLRRQIERHRSIIAQGAEIDPDPEGHIEASIRKAIQTGESKLALFQEAQARWIAYQENAVKREEANRLAAAAMAQQNGAAEIVRALVQFQQDHIDAAFSRVLKLTDLFTSKVLNSPLEMVEGELGRRVSEADRRRGCQSRIGSWIPHTAFSGTEESIAYAAFAVAISAQAKFRIVILDEIGRMDEESRRMVLERMVELVRNGTIDQFIGADVRDLDFPIDGLHICRLAGGAG